MKPAALPLLVLCLCLSTILRSEETAPPSTQEDLINACRVVTRLAARCAANSDTRGLAIMKAGYEQIRDAVADKTQVSDFDEYFAQLAAMNPGKIPELILVKNTRPASLAEYIHKSGGGFVNYTAISEDQRKLNNQPAPGWTHRPPADPQLNRPTGAQQKSGEKLKMGNLLDATTAKPSK